MSKFSYEEKLEAVLRCLEDGMSTTDILVDGKSYAVGVTEIHFDHVAGKSLT